MLVMLMIHYLPQDLDLLMPLLVALTTPMLLRIFLLMAKL
jgi:hypothetical protein